MNTRQAGLITALVMLAGGVGTVAYFLTRSAPTGPAPEEPDVLPIPDIRDFGSTPDPAALSASGTRIELEDRGDPGRVAASLAWDRLDPAEARHYDVVAPHATLYPRSGGRIVIRADAGHVFWPDRTQPPESGTLRGNVVAESYASSEEDDSPPDAVVSLPAVDFNATLGEVSTPHEFLVTFARGELSAKGMRALVNDADGRIELLDIHEGGRLTLRPTEPGPRADEPSTDDAVARGSTPPSISPAPIDALASEASPSARAQGATSASPPSDSRPDPAAAPREDLYALRLDRGVVIERGPLRASGDVMDVWVRLIDRALPEGAIPGIDMLSSAPRRNVPARRAAGAAPVAPLGLPAPLAGVVSSALGQPGGDTPESPPPPPPAAPLVITWEGPGRLVPLDAAPPELVDANHAAVRLHAARDSIVEFADASRDLTGLCSALDYRATHRRLSLTRADEPVVVNSPALGEASVSRFDLDLALGIASVPGPGEATGESQSVRWARSAEFGLAVDADARIQGLRHAYLDGEVQATTPDGSVEGGALRAWFDESLPPRAGLTRLEVDSGEGERLVARSIREADGDPPAEDEPGRARADGSIACRTLSVDLEPDAATGRARPYRLEAEGDVEASRDGATLWCRRLAADLESRAVEPEPPPDPGEAAIPPPPPPVSGPW